ncbi:Com family DNA-binding transcriptional regulator [Pseudomonas paralcaligenes]|uniref:Com family DNA-binding transcriptional regulator n=1 Tax=Pseudomonas paralcaligenes TaxID=2772558 RepID=UPI003570ACB9
MLEHQDRAPNRQHQCQPSQGPPLTRERGEPSILVRVLPRVKDVRCGGCHRLLARVGQFDALEIKCPRCRTLNHLKAESLPAECPEHLLLRPQKCNS